MTKNKISRFKISGIFAMIALLVCFVVAATFISVNAFAIDEEYAGEQPNTTTPKIWFNISGLEDGVLPQFKLADRKELVDYKLGDKIDADNDAVVSYSTYGRDYLININGSNHNYNFSITTPFGYEFDKCSTSVTKITEDTEFILYYRPDSELYNLSVKVTASGGDKVVEGAWVKFYYPDSQTYIIGTTDSKGVCEFKNLEASKATGVLIAGFDGYANELFQVTSDRYKESHSGSAILTLSSFGKANLLLNDPGEHHKTFEISLKVTRRETVLEDMKVQNETFYLVPLSVEGTWLVEPDGTLKYTVERRSEIISLSIKPLAEEGYSLTKWKLDRGSNAEEYYEPGQSFIIGEDEKLNVVPIYGTAPTPGPEPTPTPTEEVTAQTGDCAPLVPFVLLAVLAGGVLLYTRKLAKN